MLEPLFARVLLEREKLVKVGEIFIPDQAQKRNATLKCKVLAVGPSVDDSIKKLVGKWVLLGRHAGDWINEEGDPVAKDDTKEYYICQDEDILAEVR